ncbi:MAG: hypothetical protein HY736_18055 [Verrucomicrobia bacterium]|nr:hypothetical protein [Verrucomicrobiota bacterium]
MNPSPENHDKLERLIHQTLRELPSRRAPRSLESRVLAELERRAALPWWRKSFAHWPVAARVAFVILGAGVAKILLFAAVSVQAGFDPAVLTTAFARQFAWMETGLNLARSLGDFAGIVLGSIPSLWLYGGLAFVGAMYAALFGLGAAAYRTLYVNR